MKTIIIGLLTLVSTLLNAQDMRLPKDVIINLFVSTDQGDWSKVKDCFAPKVLLDYSSMSGSPATALTPDAIVKSWQSLLPGFASTHHQLGNFQVTLDGDTAHVFCYGTANHYLEDEQGDLWTVVGDYDFELTKTQSAHWQITAMKFNYKYQSGNTALAKKAIEQLK